MRAYKGFTKDLVSHLGDGKKETCHFVPGETKEVEASKTARNGFHCCENPFECLRYYSFNGENRFFIVEAGGDIDEDEDERIACTRITLIEELTPLRFAVEGMRYMITYPARQNWEQTISGARVAKDRAEANGKNHIAIARGEHPVVSGVKGSILGLIREQEGIITGVKLFIVTAEQEGRMYTLNDSRGIEEVSYAKKADREYTTA